MTQREAERQCVIYRSEKKAEPITMKNPCVEGELITMDGINLLMD